jgi:hypothetical protein
LKTFKGLSNIPEKRFKTAAFNHSAIPPRSTLRADRFSYVRNNRIRIPDIRRHPEGSLDTTGATKIAHLNNAIMTYIMQVSGDERALFRISTGLPGR